MGFVEPSLRRLERGIYMAVSMQTVLDDRLAQYVDRVKTQRHETAAAVVRELVEAGYEEAVRQLHARYQRGELTFRRVAAELGLSGRDLYDLFEQTGLSTRWGGSDAHSSRATG
jgi:AraC-like DNA-binding protein